MRGPDGRFVRDPNRRRFRLSAGHLLIATSILVVASVLWARRPIVTIKPLSVSLIRIEPQSVAAAEPSGPVAPAVLRGRPETKGARR